MWGKVRSDITQDDYTRIRELCKWGEKFSLDGFLRYWSHRFPCLALSLTGLFLQDGDGLVGTSLFVDRPS